MQQVVYNTIEVMYMTTGQRIKERRKQLGISAERLAEILDVSPATIYRYENGDIEKVPADRLSAIASVLHTTLNRLHGIEENILDPGGRIGRKSIPQKVSDKGMKLVIRIDSGLYDRLCTLAELDNRSCEDELEYLLYWAVAQEIEDREE